MNDVPTLPALTSPCHHAPIIYSLGDGVQIGSCQICYDSVVRVNLRTGLQEWLDGQSPWTTQPLRPLDIAYQNPDVLDFLPALELDSTCHGQPVVYKNYDRYTRIGVCTECNCIFARIHPLTGRIELLAEPRQAIFPNAVWTDAGERFQPWSVRS